VPRHAHLVAGIAATLCIAAFLLSTIVVELLGSAAAVARVKALIVTPGLWILIPTLVLTGGSGRRRRPCTGPARTAAPGHPGSRSGLR